MICFRRRQLIVFLGNDVPSLRENSRLLGTDVAGIWMVKFGIFFQSRVRLIQTSYSVVCCLNADATVVLNVDWRAGWEQTERGLLTNLTQILRSCGLAVSVQVAGRIGWVVWPTFIVLWPAWGDQQFEGGRLAGLAYFADTKWSCSRWTKHTHAHYSMTPIIYSCKTGHPHSHLVGSVLEWRWG